MDDDQAEGPLVFAGSASPRLTKEICGHLGVAVGQGMYVPASSPSMY